VPARQAPLRARAELYCDLLRIGPGDRYTSMSPFHHTAAVFMALTVLARGASLVPQRWFSVDNWKLAGRLGVTHALLVPTMIDLLLADGSLAATPLRVLQYGAAPIDARTLREALAALPDTQFVQIFGQTECSPITHLDHADHLRGLEDRPELLTTVGRVVPNSELRIEGADEDGIGEIAVRAPHAFVTDVDGWRRTGDLGRCSPEGYVSLHGRTGDRIVWAGENIYPIEVEQAIASHPGVREVVVVGVTDRRYGEVVKAVVVPADLAAPPSADELRDHARRRLATFKVPTIVEFIDELPRTATGKVLRRALAGIHP
jgi:acyl-CoA synthetase (AMP-forming)/AMP-acid ligase II